jgi:hypothetical protein
MSDEELEQVEEAARLIADWYAPDCGGDLEALAEYDEAAMLLLQFYNTTKESAKD